MNQYNIKLQAGNSILLHKDGFIMLNYTNNTNKDCNVFTAYESFIGTKQEVEQKISELNLKAFESDKKITIPEIKTPEFDKSLLDKFKIKK
jgi:hypothetical protein